MNRLISRQATIALLLGLALVLPDEPLALPTLDCDSSYSDGYKANGGATDYQIEAVGASVVGYLVSGYRLFASPRLKEISKLSPKAGSRMKVTGRRRLGEPFRTFAGGYDHWNIEEVYRVAPLSGSGTAYIRARDIAIQDELIHTGSKGFQVWSSKISHCYPYEPSGGMVGGDFLFMVADKNAVPNFVGSGTLLGCKPGTVCLFQRSLPDGNYEGVVLETSGKHLWRFPMAYTNPLWVGDTALFLKGSEDDAIYRADLNSGATQKMYQLPDISGQELQTVAGCDAIPDRGSMTYDEANKTLSANFIRLKNGGAEGKVDHSVVLTLEGVVVSSGATHDPNFRPE